VKSVKNVPLAGDPHPAADGRFARPWHWLALLTACGGWPIGVAAEVPLSERTVARFATVEEGIGALTVRDDFMRAMSPFDRQVLLKTDREVSEPEYLQFLSRHVLAWTQADVDQLAPLLAELSAKLAPWKLALPPLVLLVKTDGQEGAEAAYCRGPAIVLPPRILHGNRLKHVLPHEVFHVWSSHNPEPRQALYRSIGFEHTEVVALPPALAPRKITNPDAPLNNQFITVDQNGQRMELMPVLFSKTPRYDVGRGGTLFDYLEFKLMALENDDGTRRPALVGNDPVLFDPAAVPGFAEQVGRNTKYLIHPEEILADNFVFMLEGRVNLPTPRIVEQMGRILQAAAVDR
jgi:hypothetical protein